MEAGTAAREPALVSWRLLDSHTRRLLGPLLPSLTVLSFPTSLSLPYSLSSPLFSIISPFLLPIPLPPSLYLSPPPPLSPYLISLNHHSYFLLVESLGSVASSKRSNRGESAGSRTQNSGRKSRRAWDGDSSTENIYVSYPSYPSGSPRSVVAGRGSFK